ncbi:head-tail adaptor protein [Lutibacter holmesii]|uniref:Head-tail adaptor protein n=1 Tax=Lutibacter holmesii TaxID=1137985 RepID=A0ABW3WLV3_9FLAO
MNKKPQIGTLNQPVILNKITTVVSETGQKSKSEVQFINPLWAYLDDVSGNESVDGKVIALNVRKYTVRYNEEILTEGDKMVIVDADGSYNIHSIEQLGRKTYLVLKCSKRE